MNNKYLVSIIIPAYNVEKEISRCIESCLRQTYENIEVIIVDDGSKDGTGKIADEYAEKQNEIHVIHQTNKGLSGARNTGLHEMHGKYVFFLDSDDYLESKTIESMIDGINRTNAEIATCGRYDDYEDHSDIALCLDKEYILTPNELMGRILTWDGADIAACDKLYLSKLWDGIEFPEGYNNEDLCTIPVVINKATAIVHIPKPFYHYVHRSGSITTSYNEKKIGDFYHGIKAMEQNVTNLYSGLQSQLIYFCNRTYLNLVMMCQTINYRGSEYQNAKAYLRENWRNKYSKRIMSKTDKLLYCLTNLGLYNAAHKLKYSIARRK